MAEVASKTVFREYHEIMTEKIGYCSDSLNDMENDLKKGCKTGYEVCDLLFNNDITDFKNADALDTVVTSWNDKKLAAGIWFDYMFRLTNKIAELKSEIDDYYKDLKDLKKRLKEKEQSTTDQSN